MLRPGRRRQCWQGWAGRAGSGRSDRSGRAVQSGVARWAERTGRAERSSRPWHSGRHGAKRPPGRVGGRRCGPQRGHVRHRLLRGSRRQRGHRCRHGPPWSRHWRWARHLRRWATPRWRITHRDHDGLPREARPGCRSPLRLRLLVVHRGGRSRCRQILRQQQAALQGAGQARRHGAARAQLRARFRAHRARSGRHRPTPVWRHIPWPGRRAWRLRQQNTLRPLRERVGCWVLPVHGPTW